MLERLTYPAVLKKDTFDDKILYHVTFPDISSANTYGINLNDARINAQMLLKLLLNGEEILPESSSIMEVQAHFPDSMVSLITITREREE